MPRATFQWTLAFVFAAMLVLPCMAQVERASMTGTVH